MASAKHKHCVNFHVISGLCSSVCILSFLNWSLLTLYQVLASPEPTQNHVWGSSFTMIFLWAAWFYSWGFSPSSARDLCQNYKTVIFNSYIFFKQQQRVYTKWQRQLIDFVFREHRDEKAYEGVMLETALMNKKYLSLSMESSVACICCPCVVLFLESLLR